MRIERLIWQDEYIEKLSRKHGVNQQEVREILSGKPHFRFIERGHHQAENLYTALRTSKAGRHLIVFFKYKRNKEALIISARQMTLAEWRLYERH